ncbi:MAG TPA: glycosyltransferase family 2 protein [Chthoniobacterales bacterium]|nr:glycosyltransferase family 2 protein [Chthoniobacterales bacterium]
MRDENDHLRQLNVHLDELRRLLAKIGAQLALPSPTRSQVDALQAARNELNALNTFARLLKTDAAENQTRLEQAEREAWHEKVRRADATAKLKERDRLLQRIQRSVAWKIVKPIWKLFHSSRRLPSPPPITSDLAFALDLPKQWSTHREVILIKGWCFSRRGKQIAGIRAKVGNKARLARYGLERLDVADSFPHYAAAQRSGFTVEVKVPPGSSMVHLEAIEQGSEWQAFLHEQLHRETDGRTPEFDDAEVLAERPAERILKLPSLSATKAFALIEPGLRQHAARFSKESPSSPGSFPAVTTPLFSVLTPIHNTKPEWLAEAALSLLNQTLIDWEWCIVDDESDNRETRKLLEILTDVSPRVRVSSAAGKGISAAANHALELARGEYVCFLDHDDLLHPLALELMQDKLRDGYDIVYSDEDKLEDTSGELVEPFFKPDWSPEYFRGVMYVGHLLCVRRELAASARFDSAFDGVQDFEFMLRLSETGSRIGHIPEILYHWRKTPGSVAERTDAKPEIALLQERAVNAHLGRVRLSAHATRSKLPHRLNLIPTSRESYPQISVIVPTRDAPDVFGRCLTSIFEKTSYPNFEVIVMDNETTDPTALDLMENYPVRRVPFPGRFNFSRANNQAAVAATGELLVFLNNDTEIISDDWLQHLAYYAEQPDIGAVGGLLAYEDQTVQHAGVALGMRGTADHTMRRFPIDVDGYAGSLVCAREVSAVTGACLMIRKALFEEIGGFNPHFFTAYQDVDLCLRLRARGLRIVYTPQALLFHHESISRQSYYDMIDRMLLLDLWETVIEQGDPYYNRNLDLERGDYSRRSA